MKRLSGTPTVPVAGALAMAASGAASANSGIGYLTAAMPVVLPALVPVIVVEAVVLAKMLDQGARRALMLSLRANVWSTIVGLVIGVAADLLLVSLTNTAGLEPTRASASAMLVPLFAITWWVEYFTVARLAPDRGRRVVFQATGVANLISYCAMFAAAWALLPGHTSYEVRQRVADGLTSATSTRMAIDRFWEDTGRLPASIQELPDGVPTFPHGVITLEPSARLSVHLSAPGIRELDGRHLIYMPIVPDRRDDRLEWRCSSPDVPERYLPANCRVP